MSVGSRLRDLRRYFGLDPSHVRPTGPSAEDIARERSYRASSGADESACDLAQNGHESACDLAQTGHESACDLAQNGHES